MVTWLVRPSQIEADFQALLDAEIKRLGIAGVRNFNFSFGLSEYDRQTTTYAHYLSPSGPMGGDERVDATVRYFANLESLGGFLACLEEANSQFLSAVAGKGVEKIMPEDLHMPGKEPLYYADWPTLAGEIDGLYKALGLWRGATSSERKFSLSQIEPYIEALACVNEASGLQLSRFGLEELSRHFTERAAALGIVHDQRLAFKGKPEKNIEIRNRYSGDEAVRGFAAQQLPPGQDEPASLDAYLLMFADSAHPGLQPGFRPFKGRTVGWNADMFRLGERIQDNLKLMKSRVDNRHRSPRGHYGTAQNALGEFGFTRRGDMLVAMYMHFPPDQAVVFDRDEKQHPNGLTYLAWMFELDFEPTGTITSGQLASSTIIRFPSRFVAGETDPAKLAQGMTRFIQHIPRMFHVTHRMSSKEVYPTLYSDLGIDRHVANLVLNYRPGNKPVS